MPFAGYADFAACVAANSDKADPKAYCATIQAEADKAVKIDDEKRFTVAKVDEDQRLVFGWASVSISKDGSQLVDLQDDIIDPADLETAAYDFMLYSRGVDEMHRGRVKGQMVESLVVTPDKLAAMGLEAKNAPRAAWWVGFKLDPDAFAKVKSGDYKMFSIECSATPEQVEA